VGAGVAVGAAVGVAVGVAVAFTVAVAFGVAVALTVAVAITVGVGVELGDVDANTTHPNVRSTNNATMPITVIFLDNPNTIDFHLGKSAIIAATSITATIMKDVEGGLTIPILLLYAFLCQLENGPISQRKSKKEILDWEIRRGRNTRVHS
jgi:hypothetical protein